jgi:peptide deformylase
MKLKIVHYPHPALRHKTRALTSIDKDVRLQAGRMLELMYEARGLGLASPQVGLPFQMTVINVLGDANEKATERVLINPQVVDRKGGLVEGEEGCLSFPDLYQKIRRYKSVVVQYYDLEGRAMQITATDLEARLLQHEIDHLLGVLFIDKMGVIAKLGSRAMLKEFEAKYSKAQEKGEIRPDAEILRQLDALEKGAKPDLREEERRPTDEELRKSTLDWPPRADRKEEKAPEEKPLEEKPPQEKPPQDKPPAL